MAISGNHGGRLDRLARIYGAASVDERVLLAEVYEAFQALESEWRWPEGTATSILEALMTDTSHTFTAYDANGNRTVFREGPFYRDAQTGHVTMGGLPRSERLERQESYADGVPFTYDATTGQATGHLNPTLPDGTHWNAETMRPPRHQTPTARQLRQMVVDRARALGELADLERGVGMDAASWVASAAGSKQSWEKVSEQ